MSFDPKKPLDPITTEEGSVESVRANEAFRDYARMGRGTSRSLRDLNKRYMAMQKGTAPSRSWATICAWSHRYDWVARAKAFDEIQMALEQAAYEEGRKKLATVGLALNYERIAKLNTLFEKLEGYMEDETKIWLPDVKSIGVGEDAERVDIVRFNAPLIEQIRGTLDDIAKEVGQRVKKLEHSGPDGAPVTVASPEQMEEIRQKRWAGAAAALAGALVEDDGVTADELANE